MYRTIWRTSTPSNQGRPSVFDTVKEKLLTFLKQPDFLIVIQDEKALFIWEKMLVVKEYTQRNYLLWNLTEIVTIFNSDQNF